MKIVGTFGSRDRTQSGDRSLSPSDRKQPLAKTVTPASGWEPRDLWPIISILARCFGGLRLKTIGPVKMPQAPIKLQPGSVNCNWLNALPARLGMEVCDA
jgi:hypothetical protein